MTLDLSKLKKTTVLYLAMLIAGSAAAQTLWVRNHVIPLIESHPHLSFLGPLILGAITLLHNPVTAQVISEFASSQTTDLPSGGKQVTEINQTTKVTPDA